jgi:hypothetical protein
VLPIGAHHDRRGTLETGHSFETALRRPEQAETSRRLPAEDGHRVAGEGGRVDVLPVRAHGKRDRAVETHDLVDPVDMSFREGQRARHRLAREDRHRVVQIGGCVDLLTVGADGDRRRAAQTADPGISVLHRRPRPPCRRPS